MLRALVAAVRRFLSRRAARRLLAKEPRGLRQPSLALPLPPPEPPHGEFWTAGRRPWRLLRLAALPPPASRLDVVRPRTLRLDAEFSPANEGVVPFARNDPAYRWLSPEFRRRFIDLPWMAQDRIRFLGPMHAEWFVLWWDQAVKENLGPRLPRHWDRPDEVDWAMDNCKEQMLIRRDVVKDEQGPPAAELSAPALGHPLLAWDTPPLPELVPPKEWVEMADPQALAPRLPPGRAPREAYLRWRTLMDALGER